VSGPSGADLDRAWRVISAQLDPAPLLARPALGAGVQLKLETWQPTGAFRVRGALAALSRESSAGAGVVTASTGNHALGVAFAADRLGVPATVVVPENVSRPSWRRWAGSGPASSPTDASLAVSTAIRAPGTSGGGDQRPEHRPAGPGPGAGRIAGRAPVSRPTSPARALPFGRLRRPAR
jgi:Pyridoxal-phosphate dependent enzyme